METALKCTSSKINVSHCVFRGFTLNSIQCSLPDYLPHIRQETTFCPFRGPLPNLSLNQNNVLSLCHRMVQSQILTAIDHYLNIKHTDTNLNIQVLMFVLNYLKLCSLIEMFTVLFFFFQYRFGTCSVYIWYFRALAMQVCLLVT